MPGTPTGSVGTAAATSRPTLQASSSAAGQPHTGARTANRPATRASEATPRATMATVMAVPWSESANSLTVSASGSKAGPRPTCPTTAATTATRMPRSATTASLRVCRHRVGERIMLLRLPAPASDDHPETPGDRPCIPDPVQVRDWSGVFQGHFLSHPGSDYIGLSEQAGLPGPYADAEPGVRRLSQRPRTVMSARSDHLARSQRKCTNSRPKFFESFSTRW